MKKRAAFELTLKLTELRNFYVKLLGDKWPAKVAEWEPDIRSWMKDNGCELMPAATQMAWAIKSTGGDPSILLAVATQLVIDEGKRK